MLLAVPQPYDFHLSTVRFRDFGTDGATVWHEDGLHRVVAGREIRVEPADGGVRIDPASPEAAAEVSRLLGLPFELDPFREWAARDPALGPIVGAAARIQADAEPAPVRGARRRDHDTADLSPGGRSHSWPIRAALSGFGTRSPGSSRRGRSSRERIPRDFPALGFSRKKAEYVIGLARSDLDLEALAALPDEDVIATLTAVPGLGRWTADWFLARHLARPHAWPAGDLGVRKAVSTFYADGRPLSIPEVRAMGDRFAPFQNLSAQFLLAGARMAG